MGKPVLKPLTVHIDAALHRRLKTKAAREGRLIRVLVEDALRKDLGRKPTARRGAA